MEDHFERVLAAAGGSGKRPAGPQSTQTSAKRPRAAPDASAAQVAALVDGAEAQEADSLDARALKSMANALRKAVRRNALAREKHADEPAKFLDSELALDAELTRWRPVGAHPELLPVLAELGVPRVLLGLFAHENLDIRLAVLSLLAELTDVDAAAASLEPARELAQHLVDEKLLPLLVSNLFQLDAALVSQSANTTAEPEEEAAGLYHSLQILENLADLAPGVCAQAAADTALLPFLLSQVAPRRIWSENKLYASEILSIVLQSGAEPRERFVAWRGAPRPSEEASKTEKKQEKVDLLDELLQALAPYRKRDPASEEEEELVENLVNALCSVLLVPEAQQQFRRLEGPELLLRCLKDRQRFVFGGALRALDHALMGNARNCERLVELGGLRNVFSVFMGRMGKHKALGGGKNKAGARAKQEENAASLVASLCSLVRQDAPQDAFDRLHAKFVEKDMEKMDRLVDLFVRYHVRVQREEKAEAEEEEEEDEDERYLRRLDAGLFVLERTALVVAHLCRFSRKLRAYVMVKFHERNVEPESLASVLREQLELLEGDTVENKSDSKDGEKKLPTSDEAKEAQKTQLRELLETLEDAQAPIEQPEEQQSSESVAPTEAEGTDDSLKTETTTQ